MQMDICSSLHTVILVLGSHISFAAILEMF
jgi:hypothetical protein